MNTILITGVAGFIGSTLAERLIENYRVVGIDNFDSFYDRKIKERNISALLTRHSFTFIEGSILDIEALYDSNAAPDCVIHLAAKAGVHMSVNFPQEYMEANVKGTQAILDFMVKRNVKKIIFGSSSSVYGDSEQIPFKEDYVTDYQISPYAVTKKSGELLCRAFSHLYKLDVLCLRFFTVYGPRQRPDLAIHKFFLLIKNSKPIQIYGDGTMSRDYTFIDDTVDGIVLALKYLLKHTGVFETINLGNKYPVSLIELISRISEIVQEKIVIDYVKEKPGDVRTTYANIDKAQEMLGYSPKTTISEGLRIFHKWFAANGG